MQGTERERERDRERDWKFSAFILAMNSAGLNDGKLLGMQEELRRLGII